MKPKIPLRSLDDDWASFLLYRGDCAMCKQGVYENDPEEVCYTQYPGNPDNMVWVLHEACAKKRGHWWKASHINNG